MTLADNRPSPPRMTAPAAPPRSLRQPRPTGGQRRAGDRRQFVRLAEDVLDRRDRDRRGGSVLPDSTRPVSAALQMEKDPTGIAALRLATGDVPHDPVRTRLVADEADLARLCARLGAPLTRSSRP